MWVYNLPKGMSEIVSIQLEDLARLTGKKAVELKSELFNVDGEEITQKDSAGKFIAGLFHRKFESIKDENYGWGQRTANLAIEEYVKSKGFTPESDIKGTTDLLEAWAATLQKSEGGKGSKLTTEELEQNQIAQEWLSQKAKALKDGYEAKIGTLNEQLTQAQQKSLKDRVQREALGVLESSNWIAGEDEDTRRRRVDTIFRLLEYNHLKEDEGGALVVLDDSGNVRKDATFNPVSFGDYVKEVNPFGFHKFDPGKQSPSPNPQPGKPGQDKPKIVIRDQAHYEELRKQRNQERDPAKRQALIKELQEAWIAQRPA